MWLVKGVPSLSIEPMACRLNQQGTFDGRDVDIDISPKRPRDEPGGEASVS